MDSPLPERVSSASTALAAIITSSGSPGDPQLPVTVHHRHMEFRLQKPDIFIKRAEQIDGLLHSLDAYTLFHTGQAPYLCVVSVSGSVTVWPICSRHSAFSTTVSRSPCRTAAKRVSVTVLPSGSRADSRASSCCSPS